MNSSLLVARNAAFWRGAVVALALSFGGAVVFAVSTPLIGVGAGLRVLLIILSLLYLGYILRAQSGSKVDLNGRSLRTVRGVPLSLFLWVVLVSTLCMFNPVIWVWLTSLVALLWLIRCLRCYRSLFAAAADALLNGLALFLALATALHTQSVFLSLWCFFLIQAALVFLPGTSTGSPTLCTDPTTSVGDDPEQSFDAACRTAETVLRKLTIS